MLGAVQDEAAAALGVLGLELPRIPEVVPSIHFPEALRLVSEGLGHDVSQEPDLAPAHEAWLGEWAQRELGSDFLFVTGYPTAKRPFYAQPDPAWPELSNSFDLLFRGLELVTGGQRLHRYQDYVAALASRGLDPEPFAGYLQAFKYGMPPHGGCALGLERWLARLTGAANVREAALFPRDLKRLTP
jgi:nondiscriminating aspartyl-tRNA synthetase